MKKIVLSLLIAAALMLTGCEITINHGTTAPETTATERQDDPPEEVADLLEEAKKRLEPFSAYDCGGQRITLVAPVDAVDIYQPSSASDALDSARAYRNTCVSEKIGVSVTVMYTRGDIASEIALYRDSGELYADLVSVPQNRVGLLARAGLLQNLTALPYAAVRGGYFNQTGNPQSGAVYGVCGEFNFSPSDLSCVYFNAALCREYGIDPYAMYREGRWSLDGFLTVLRGLDTSLRENNYGYVWMSPELGSENTVTDLVFSAMGLKYMYPDGDAFAMTGDARTEKAVSAARDLLSLRRLSVTDMLYNGDAFSGGRVCFYTDTLDYASHISVAVEWGAIPVPSADGQSFVSLLSPSSQMLCMLSASSATAACGAYIGGCAAFSCGYIAEAFLRDVLSGGARTSDALASFRAVIASASVDYAFMFAPAYEYCAAASYGAVRTAVKSGRTVSDIVSGVIDRARGEL